MNPDLYGRLLDHSDALGVELRARHVHEVFLPVVDGELHPNGGYCPTDRDIILEYADSIPDPVVEAVALHELGHAATLFPTEDRVREHRLEMAFGRISEATKREEVEAWEWAARHLSPAARSTAVELAASALRTYHVPEPEIERVQRLLAAGA